MRDEAVGGISVMGNSMHVLMLAPGLAFHSKKLATWFLQAGCQVTFLDYTDPELPKASGYRYIRYKKACLARVPFAESRWLEPCLQAWKMRRICEKIRPDVVHVSWVDERAYYLALGGIRPLILNWWGSDINDVDWESAGNLYYRKRIAHALRRADLVTADARDIMEKSRQIAGQDIKHAMFYYGINMARFKPGYETDRLQLRRKLNIPPDAKVFLNCRRLLRSLGTDTILNAFSSLVRRRRSDNVVLILKRIRASDDAYVASLERKIDNLGIHAKVRWVDELSYDTLPAQYALADAVLNCPEKDGLPVSLFEAAACRRPVICTNLPAYREVFENCFVFVSPSAEEEVVAAMETVLHQGDTGLQEKLDAAYQATLRFGNEVRNMQDLLEHCRRLVQGAEG